LEIIDIKDPENPRTLSILKLPNFHRGWPDLWDVQVSGNYAYVGDSEAGLFIADISDTANPFFVEHVSLPGTEPGKNEPVCGYAIGDGVVYLTGLQTDAYIVEPGIGKTKPIVFEKSGSTPYWKTDTVIDHTSPSVYDPGNQVHAAYVSEKWDKAFVAAGYGGVHEVQLSPELRGKQILDTKSIVFDIDLRGDKIYLAEGMNGLSAWKYNKDDPPELLGRYKPDHEAVFQLLIDPEEKFALLHAGHSTLDIVDISNPLHMRRVKKFRNRPPFYRLPIARGFMRGRYAACFWPGQGCYLYDIRKEEGVDLVGQVFPPILWINGMAIFDDRIMTIHEGGYLLGELPREDGNMSYDKVSIENIWLEGKPTIYGSRLFVSNRQEGEITVIDISDVYAPNKIWQLNLNGNPGLVSQHRDMVIVPAGRDGLMIFNAENGEPYYGSN